MRQLLPRTFHLGGYWRGPNDMVRQMMLGLRAAGAEVCEFNTDENPEALDCEERPYDRGRFGPVWLNWPVLEPSITGFNPEVIICDAGGLSFRPDVAHSLRRSKMLLGVALSDPDVFSPSTSKIAENFDLFLTNASSCIPKYRALGVDAAELPLATNEEFFHPVPPSPELYCEILIVGRAHSDRIEPVRRLLERFRVHIYGEGWQEHGIESRGAIYGDQLLTVLNSARLAVVFSRTPAGHAIGKVAVLDFIAAGALVAVEQIPELESYLNSGREILTFASTDELIEKARYYLERPEEAEAIRLAGRTRILERHTWRRVWPGILNQLAEAKAACPRR